MKRCSRAMSWQQSARDQVPSESKPPLPGRGNSFCWQNGKNNFTSMVIAKPSERKLRPLNNSGQLLARALNVAPLPRPWSDLRVSRRYTRFMINRLRALDLRKHWKAAGHEVRFDLWNCVRTGGRRVKRYAFRAYLPPDGPERFHSPLDELLLDRAVNIDRLSRYHLPVFTAAQRILTLLQPVGFCNQSGGLH